MKPISAEYLEMNILMSFSIKINEEDALVIAFLLHNKELLYNYSMDEDAVDELMLDIIEIVNPIGDVYTDLLTRFNEFKKEL